VAWVNPLVRSRRVVQVLRTGGVLAVALASITVLLRLPFQTELLSHRDEVQYALGLHHFDVVAHQPHPPGSPFYMLFGRAAFVLTGDEHQAFVLLAMLASAAAVVAEYRLTCLAFGRRAGLLAAAALATQPIFWAYGAAGSAWTVLALLATVTGTCCLLLLRGERRAAIPSALVIGLASGFRPDVTVFMGPLWLWSLWRAESRLARRALCVVLGALCVLVWVAPVAWLSGGLDRWLYAYVQLFMGPPTEWNARLRGFAVNTLIVWGITLVVIGPLVVLGIIAAGWSRMVAVTRSPENQRLLLFSALWTGPVFVFLWAFDATEAGHNLLYLGGLIMLAAGLAARATTVPWKLAIGGALLVAAQVLVFLLASPRTENPFAYPANSILLNFTAPALRQQDVALEASLAAIRADFDPSDTTIITLSFQDLDQYASFYLTDYPMLRLNVDAGPGSARLSTRGQSLTLPPPTNQPSTCLLDGTERNLVWLLRPTGSGTSLWAPARGVPIALPGGERSPIALWQLPIGAEPVFYHGFALAGCAPAPID
jgi:hypothetical protein